MIADLRPWTPRAEIVRNTDGTAHERPDYWSRPYPATPAMQAAIRAGLERQLPRERDSR